MNSQNFSSRLSSGLERVFAYALAFSPPIAVLLALIFAIFRRRKIKLVREEPWTVGAFLLLGALGAASGLLAPSQRQAAAGLLAMGLLMLCWTAGRFAVLHPRRFYVDLQRAIGVVGILALLAIFARLSIHVAIGAFKLTVVGPDHVGTVFGLGDNGLGPLLVFGGILALGRLAQMRSALGRFEGVLIFGVALMASLALGVRNALWGSLVGAVVLMPLIGPVGLVVVLAVAAMTIWLQPPILSTFIAPLQSGVWSSLVALLKGGWDQARWDTWQSALGMLRDHPWLGVGPFHFLLTKDLYAPKLSDLGVGAHSIYLHVASEWGIPAALLLFGWVLSWMVRIWRHRSEAWRWSLIAGLASFLAMGIWDDPLFTLHISAPVFVGLGLAAARPADNGVRGPGSEVRLQPK